MGFMTILVVGIVIAIAFIAICAAVIAMAPYIAVGVIIVVILPIAIYGDREPKKKPPE